MTATREGRCDAHAVEYEQERGSRQSRGYDRTFDAARRRWAPKVAAGGVVCWRCGEAIGPGQSWDLGHGDGGRINGPEHRGSCNLRAAGLKAAGREWSPAAPRAPLSDELTASRALAQKRAERAAERRRRRYEQEQ